MSEIKNIVNKYRRETTLSSGNKASVKLLSLTPALAVSKQLLKIIAPAVGGTMDGLRHDEVLHGAPKSFTELGLVLCQQIDQAKIESLIVVLLEDLYINGDPVDIEDYFTANFGELVEVIEFSLKENFSTFFTGRGIKARFMQTIQNLMGTMSPESEHQ